MKNEDPSRWSVVAINRLGAIDNHLSCWHGASIMQNSRRGSRVFGKGTEAEGGRERTL
jgi:hypothetical protein